MELQGQHLITIFNGESFVSDDPWIVVATVLGSCIAVCLYDEQSRIGGMNHFMLDKSHREAVAHPGWYGYQSLQALILELIKRGAQLSRLRAKVYGGAKMLQVSKQPQLNVALNNIRFTLDFLKKEAIPVVEQDLGGTRGRKVFFRLVDFQVRVKLLAPATIRPERLVTGTNQFV